VTIRTRIRVLGLAATLGLAVIVDSGGQAYALPNNPHPKNASACLAQGYQWDDVQGCADKQCTYNGRTYGHNDLLIAQTPDGVPMRCDGFTGTWRLSGTTSPGGPSHPRTPPPTVNRN